MRQKELLLSLHDKDFIVDTFHSGGPGGQNQNKRETGVRITHKESGATGEARDSRDQKTNKRNALKRLSESSKFKIWLNRKIYEIENKKSIEQEVDEMLNDESIKTEIKNEKGQWTEIKDISELT